MLLVEPENVFMQTARERKKGRERKGKEKPSAMPGREG